MLNGVPCIASATFNAVDVEDNILIGYVLTSPILNFWSYNQRSAAGTICQDSRQWGKVVVMDKPALGQFYPYTNCFRCCLNLSICIGLIAGWKVCAKADLVFNFRNGIAQRCMGYCDRCAFDVT